MVGLAEQNANSRHELGDAERFREIVVRSRIEGADLFTVVCAYGKYDDRDLRPFAQPLNDLQAVEIGQPQIQDDEIGRGFGAARDSILGTPCFRYVKAVRLKADAQKFSDLCVVFDDQDARHHLYPPPGSRRSAV